MPQDPQSQRPEATTDYPFFHEWYEGRAAGRHRSLLRARALLEDLLPHSLDPDLPRVAVVGSKGKGTTAAFCSAYLAAAKKRVGTLTSPGYRSNRERIRVNGSAISTEEYTRLVGRVSATVWRSGSRYPTDGYLSPTGMFTIAAATYFTETRCDVWVLEAGIGGASDEVSLLAPQVVAFTEIFGEHLGVLGNSVEEIAREKAGIVNAGTRITISADQRQAVWNELERGRQPGSIEVVRANQPAVPAGLLPSGKSLANAMLGLAAGYRVAGEWGWPRPTKSHLTRVLSTVRLPGRLSLHTRGNQTWLVDSPINSAGVEVALGYCRAELGDPSAILISLPDVKDSTGVEALLHGTRWYRMKSHAEHLTFDGWGAQGAYLDDLPLDDLGPRVLAIGTISFVGEVLEVLGVDTLEIFRNGS